MTKVDDRIAGLRAALSVAPTDRVLAVLLARTLEAAGQAAGALDVWRHVSDLDRADPDARLGMARCYLSLAKPGAARLVLDELEQSGEMPAEGWRLRGTLAAEGVPAAPIEPGVASVGGMAAPQPDRRRVTFVDVGGLEEQKEAIRLRILYPVEHPELYAAYRREAGGGLLLYGPPGCGKTYLARAAAGELARPFIPVGIADVLDMWVGSSERNLRAIFENARAHRPCVLFFDELDALAADRGAMRASAWRSLVNLFLAEMDGVRDANEGILVIGATNAPWHVDPAFRRPGRFDEVLFVPPPDHAARLAILRMLVRDRPVADLDLERLARATDGFSGADLRGLIERSLDRNLAASVRDGVIRPLRTSDLMGLAKGRVPSTREWFETARNYERYANQSGLYDPVADYRDRE
jgi:AAA+ superfamily predicted ATPase